VRGCKQWLTPAGTRIGGEAQTAKTNLNLLKGVGPVDNVEVQEIELEFLEGLREKQGIETKYDKI